MPKLLVALVLSLLALCAHGATALPAAPDRAALEPRVMALAEELRCLVCQNQTLADSHAELAMDLKNQIREKLAQGQSEQQVTDFMVQRYGDFVRYRPPLKSSTLLLWFGPFVLLAIGFALLARVLGRPAAPPASLPERELQRAASLLYGPAETREKP